MAKIVESEEELEAIVMSLKTVAVVGAKDESEPESAAFGIPRKVQSHGIKITPVNPKLREALGEKALRSLADLPHAVDMVNVFRRSEAIPGIADEVLALPADKRPKVFWMQTGIRHDEAAKKLVAAGIDVVQDACLGVLVGRYR